MNTIPDDQMKDLIESKDSDVRRIRAMKEAIADLHGKKTSNVHVVAKMHDVRIITYDLDGKHVWEVQKQGNFFFWKWYRQKRWYMEGENAVLFP
jgi:tRNA A-37 threonylcarbamoyl transferase component Bud32